MDRGHTTIKAVVIGLGLLIIGLTVVLVIGIVDRTGDAVATVSESERDAPAAGTFADVAVALPPGASVRTVTGQGDALSLLVDLPGGAQNIVTIDRRSGEVLGTLELVPRSQ